MAVQTFEFNDEGLVDVKPLGDKIIENLEYAGNGVVEQKDKKHILSTLPEGVTPDQFEASIKHINTYNKANHYALSTVTTRAFKGDKSLDRIRNTTSLGVVGADVDYTVTRSVTRTNSLAKEGQPTEVTTKGEIRSVMKLGARGVKPLRHLLSKLLADEI